MTDLVAVQKIAGWEKLKTLVLDSVSSPITKRVYNMALDEFLGWFQQAPTGRSAATVTQNSRPSRPTRLYPQSGTRCDTPLQRVDPHSGRVTLSDCTGKPRRGRLCGSGTPVV
jgi:hypothetical protein